ncbi:MAG TPA: hypothetical protein VGK67_24540 [Myxococcales bacterium]|jgi:hypothetical protein
MAKSNSERERIRNLIALDAEGVVKRVAERKDEMIAMFGLHRDREPLLSPLRSWVPSASFQELTQLSTGQQSAVTAFYEVLDGLRWYFRYTNDMPGTAQQVFAHHRKRLAASYLQLQAALGPAVAVPASEAPEAPPPAPEEKRPRRRPGRKRAARPRRAARR